MRALNGALAPGELRSLVQRMPNLHRQGNVSTFACPLDSSTDGHAHVVYYYENESSIDCDQGHQTHLVLDAMRKAASVVPDLAKGPPPCPDARVFGHRFQPCIRCMVWNEWARRQARSQVDALEEVGAGDDSLMRVSGGSLFDTPLSEPIWGQPETPLSAEGQGWMIVGPDGTGKTSVACQYVKTRLGIYDDMWGLPVKPLPDDQSVYYLAMDRPRQMMAAFMRGVGPELRQMLDRRLFVHKGPPPYRLSHDRGQRWFLDQVEETGAGLVVFDSRKDLGSTVDAESVTGIAMMVQILVAADIDVLVLAHPHKGRRNGPPSLEDVSGHREVFSGLGSVLFLDGSAGQPLISVYQVKPIQEVCPPMAVLHDHRAGLSDVVAGLVPTGEAGGLEGGRMPVDKFEVRVLACIDAHPDGVALSASLKEVLRTENLSRDLKYLVQKQVIESNGARGPQSGYRRGANAPERATSDG